MAFHGTLGLVGATVQFEIARSIRHTACDQLHDVFYSEMVDSMNEPPGARMRVGLSALTVAEYFREDLQQDVLLFIGYQPTLATEMVQAEERPVIASRRICGGLPLQLELASISDPYPGHCNAGWRSMSNPFTVGSVSSWQSDP